MEAAQCPLKGFIISPRIQPRKQTPGSQDSSLISHDDAQDNQVQKKAQNGPMYFIFPPDSSLSSNNNSLVCKDSNSQVLYDECQNDLERISANSYQTPLKKSKQQRQLLESFSSCSEDFDERQPHTTQRLKRSKQKEPDYQMLQSCLVQSSPQQSQETNLLKSLSFSEGIVEVAVEEHQCTDSSHQLNSSCDEIADEFEPPCDAVQLQNNEAVEHLQSSGNYHAGSLNHNLAESPPRLQLRHQIDYAQKLNEIMLKFGFLNQEVVIEEEDPALIQLTTQMSTYQLDADVQDNEYVGKKVYKQQKRSAQRNKINLLRPYASNRQSVPSIQQRSRGSEMRNHRSSLEPTSYSQLEPLHRTSISKQKRQTLAKLSFEADISISPIKQQAMRSARNAKRFVQESEQYGLVRSHRVHSSKSRNQKN